MNPYFTVNDSEHFTFYRIPKLLFTDEIYQTVSTDAKIDRKSTRLNSSHLEQSRMPSSA